MFSFTSSSSRPTQRPLLHPSQFSAARKKCYSLPRSVPRLQDWSSFFMMTSLYTFAILAAATQHFFYTALNGREIDTFFLSQVSVSRVTTALIFLFKMCIVAAVGIAYTHAFWNRVRGSAIAVKGLDSMLGVLKNPFQFLNSDILFRAKVLFIVAIVSWTLPLAAIFVPGALTVTSNPSVSIEPVDVPVLGPLDSDVGFVEIGTAAILLGATQQIRRIATRVLTSGEIISLPSPCGSNCSYSLSFFGPAYDCENATDLSQAPSSITGFVTPDVLTVWGSVDDYEAPGTEKPSSLSSQGLWIRTGLDGPDLILLCTVHNATYQSNVTYANNLQTITTEVTLHDQIPSSVIQNYNDIAYEHANNSTALWQSINMFAIQDSVAGLLSGVVTQSANLAFNFNRTLIAMSDFVQFSPGGLTIKGDLAQQLEELLVNTTLSLNFFLQRPPIPQVVGENSISFPVINITANASIISYASKYSYSPATLWIPYSLALSTGFLCVLVGCMMLIENGVDSNMSFSQLLVTTRNSSLDALADGACLGGGAISHNMQRVKLRYGQLQTGLQDEDDSEEVVAHAAFGLNDEIVPLRRGRMYA